MALSIPITCVTRSAVGAALIDQYDTDDLFDPDPNPPNNGNYGNTITIIDSSAATPQTTSTG